MWTLANKSFTNRLLLGTAQYPSLQTLQAAVAAAEAEIITVSLRRHYLQGKGGEEFSNFLQQLPCEILPNTAGCRTANAAVTMAEMAREIFNTSWIKVEVLGDDYTLQPDPFELLNACKILISKGFEVFPYCSDDLILCQRLVDVGCKILMPGGSPIGSGKGLINPYALEMLRTRLPKITLILDAGIGKTSHAVQALELGFDGVLLNTAVALAKDPVQMALAFKHAVSAGRLAYTAGLMLERNMAQPSTALLDTPFWHSENDTE